MTAKRHKPVNQAKKSAIIPRKGTKRPPLKVKKRPVVRPVSAGKPMNFATEPVTSELMACSIKDHQAATAGLCLNCAEQALSTARAFTGLKYQRGGTNPNVGFDCSGFVQHVFASSCGRQLPRSAREQFEFGAEIEKSELQRGDLVFFSSRSGWHVGIYTGNNEFIHSPNRRESIRVSSLETPYYKRMYKGARRITTDIAPNLASDTVSIPTN